MKHYLSLGAGVQSSTLALMAAAGEVGPMPDGAIFADTQAEPTPVYRWLDWLEKQLPFPVHRVSAGNLEAEALLTRVSPKGVSYHRTAIPFHTQNANGDAGRVTFRTCTRDYKIRPILKAARRLAGVKRGTSDPVVTSWIGISLDEMQRMKPARESWVVNRWPLIELRMTRAGCLEWLRSHGHPEPPRSACTFCPFRSNREWRWLKQNDPEGFARAVAFDEEARRDRTNASLQSIPYVHRSLQPLDQVDLRSDEERGQMLMWADECEGMCGV
jgi:hypothetical protein